MKDRSHGGFTLIELIVALAVFALSGAVLTTAYLNMLETRHAVERMAPNAPDLHLVRMALGGEPVLDKVTAWNELDLPQGRHARWRARVTATDIADLFDVALEIQLTDQKGSVLADQVEQLRLLRPTWSDPREREALRTAARNRLARRVMP